MLQLYENYVVKNTKYEKIATNFDVYMEAQREVTEIVESDAMRFLFSKMKMEKRIRSQMELENQDAFHYLDNIRLPVNTTTDNYNFWSDLSFAVGTVISTADAVTKLLETYRMGKVIQQQKDHLQKLQKKFRPQTPGERAMNRDVAIGKSSKRTAISKISLQYP